MNEVLRHFFIRKLTMPKIHFLSTLFLCYTMAATANPAQSVSELNQCASVPMTALGGLIKLGDAHLYMENCQARDQILESIPKLFSIQLTRDVKGEQLSKLANKYLLKNLGSDRVDAGMFDCITGQYTDAKDGDQYDVRYTPGDGLSLILNDKTIGKCEASPALAQYFVIWFGDKPFNRHLKNALLQEENK